MLPHRGAGHSSKTGKNRERIIGGGAGTARRLSIKSCKRGRATSGARGAPACGRVARNTETAAYIYSGGGPGSVASRAQRKVGGAHARARAPCDGKTLCGRGDARGGGGRRHEEEQRDGGVCDKGRRRCASLGKKCAAGWCFAFGQGKSVRWCVCVCCCCAEDGEGGENNGVKRGAGERMCRHSLIQHAYERHKESWLAETSSGIRREY